MPSFSPFRAGLVMLVVCCALVGMTGRVAYLQTFARQKTIRSAEGQQHVTQPIPARPGTVFDRNGHMLAGSLQTSTLYIDPKFMLQQYQREKRNLNQMDEDLRKLCRLVELDYDDLLDLLARHAEDRYEKLAEDVSAQVAAEVEKLDIPGVGFEASVRRFYPMGSVAAHVLGAVGKEGSGLEGIELQYRKLLAGKPGFRRVEKDARGRAIGIDAGDLVPPQHGKHLMLTLDANIQIMAEEELGKVCRTFGAKYGEVVVMDPHTGEVLALANYPTFNPQNLEDSTPRDRLNRAIVVPYEPGSTLKPFIVGPALEARQTRLTDVWPIEAISHNPYGRRRVTDVHFYGPLSTWDVLVKSSNIGMSMLAERMGNPALHAALKQFGFGQRTGIELPGEDQGLLFPLRRWGHASTVSIAQGYEMMVTPLQLARAYCTYANGGRLIKPRLVRGTLDEDGQVIESQPPTKLDDCPQAVGPRAVRQIQQALSDVVIRGTAQGKGSKYWNIFGKTGTAHISRGRAGYAANLYNSSFMGAGPLEDPRVVVVMVVHEPDPRKGKYGGTVSAPAAIKLLERTLAYLQVPPSPMLQPPPADVASVLVNFDAKKYEKTGLSQ